MEERRLLLHVHRDTLLLGFSHLETDHWLMSKGHSARVCLQFLGDDSIYILEIQGLSFDLIGYLQLQYK